MTELELADCLEHISIGEAVAEQDTLLATCRIETPHFTQLFNDRIDLILGTKGAGKSSLFRIFGEVVSKTLLEKRNVIVVTGVETRGEPVFKHYEASFNKFTEKQYETFWKAYILGLIYNKLKYDAALESAAFRNKETLERFFLAYEGLHLLDLGRIYSPTQILKLICGFTVAAIENSGYSYDIEKGEIKYGPVLSGPMAGAYKNVTVPDITKLDTVVAIDALFEFARVNGYKIWVMLDHLDVIFKRRSLEETSALRALLRISPAFKSSEVSLKIFLRDDILDSIGSDGGEPIAGLSHIAARSAKLSWTSDELCMLIMKRFAANPWMKTTYSIDGEKLSDADYARRMFNAIFPFKYITQTAFDWICSLVTDGRGIITPRDVIDLIKTSFRVHSMWLRRHPGKTEIMSIDSIKEAHDELSKHRRETVLQTEFSHLMADIRRFEHNKDKYSREEMCRIFGEHWEETVSRLCSVGVIGFNPKRAEFYIAKLYAPGLHIQAKRKSSKRKGKGIDSGSTSV